MSSEHSVNTNTTKCDNRVSMTPWRESSKDLGGRVARVGGKVSTMTRLSWPRRVALATLAAITIGAPAGLADPATAQARAPHEIDLYRSGDFVSQTESGAVRRGEHPDDAQHRSRSQRSHGRDPAPLLGDGAQAQSASTTRLWQASRRLRARLGGRPQTPRRRACTPSSGTRPCSRRSSPRLGRSSARVSRSACSSGVAATHGS